MHMRRGLKGLTLVAGFSLASMSFVASSAQAQNVLANPGFETGTSIGGPELPGSPGWSTFGNTFTESAPNPAPIGPHAGTGDLKEFGTFPGVSGAFQQFNSNPGDVWTFTGFGANASSDPMQAGNFGELKISFHNAGGEILGVDGNHIDTSTPSNTWTPLSAVGTAPAGTTFVQLFELFVQPATNGGSAFFDDVSASVVVAPEPASLGLLGIGGLLALRRRSRIA
jgi:hypothetical protein